MGDIRVGTATADDAGELAELLERFFSEEGFELPAGGMETRVLGYLSLPHHAVFAAREESRLIGVATVASNFGLEYGWAAELEDLYVVPERRTGGVGRALVDAAVAWAGADGCTAVLVTVTQEGQDRHDLVAFYRHLGFVDEGRKILELDLMP